MRKGGQALSDDAEARRRGMYETGMNDSAIALAEGVSAVAICRWRRRRGLRPVPRVYGNRLPQEEDERRRAMVHNGLTTGEIAKVCGVQPQSIRQWRRTRGLSVRDIGATIGSRRGAAARKVAAVARFRDARRACEALGVPTEQLDALEPFLPDPPAPDPRPTLTPEQREALMLLADAHDAVLTAGAK